MKDEKKGKEIIYFIAGPAGRGFRWKRRATLGGDGNNLLWKDRLKRYAFLGT